MQLRGASIAVTGATGFLGRYIVRALQGRGAHVIGVVRNPDRVPELARQGVELRQADLSDPERLTRGFAGADAIVSNAALLSLRNRNREHHLRTNVRGTLHVTEAAAAARVRRMVQISSVSVYRGRLPRPADEDTPQHDASDTVRRTNVYGVSKALSEQTAWSQAGKLGLALTTLRPCGIYGAFDANFTAVFKALLGTLPIAVFPAFMRICPVYAGDVAEAVALALERPASVGRAYNVTGEDRSTWKLAEAWRQVGGKSARLWIPLPVPYQTIYDNRRARKELGWSNRPYLEAMRETLELERG